MVQRPRFSIPKIWPITAQGYRESHGHQFRYLLRPVRFVWFSLGQKLSWALNDRGTLKDTTTSTKMRFCLVIYSLLNLWKLSWEFPGNSSILLLFQLLKVDFDILFEHNHQPPPKIETENHVAGIQFFAWTTIWYRPIFSWSCEHRLKTNFDETSIIILITILFNFYCDLTLAVTVTSIC